MPTLRQRKLAEAIVENASTDNKKTASELLAVAGYEKGTIKGSPSRTIEQIGVQEALEEFGFTESNAKSVVAEILLDPDADQNTRLKAASEVFKVAGSYAPEKKATLNVNLEARNPSDQELETLRLEYEEKLRNQLTA